MGQIVVLAEKPSVGKSISTVLGCNQHEDGYDYNSKYIVTWAVGHLCELQEPGEIDEKYKSWSFDNLPILPDYIPLKINSTTKKQFNVVSKLLNGKNTDSIVCATDAGREGELIFRYIYIMAGCKKPFKRLWISSMTDEAIRDGFRNLKPGTDYDSVYASAKCRSEADWLVGMNASRAFSVRYETTLSVGRVQTPTLAFLVKRKEEIEKFVPVPYATLKADFGDYKGIMFSDKLSPDTHIPQVSQAEIVKAKIIGKPAVVTSAETQRKKENPPQLFDLTSLQRESNRRFGYTAEKTLSIVQSLYENHKALTYPRTDSKYLTNDMIPVIPVTFKALPDEYQPFVDGALNNGKVEVSKRIFDESKVSDHHAIIPTTETANISEMNEAEKNIFDLVTRRTLAAFYPPCEYDSTKIITTADRFTFRTVGKTIIKDGWRKVVSPKSDEKNQDDENEEEALPVLKSGDRRTVKDAYIKEDMTKPPAHYTDATLLTAMETAGKDSEDEEIVQQMKGHGIGTPATRAQIIERIIKVGYAERKGKSIIATAKGDALIHIMPDEISSAETTGRWEIALEQIAGKTRDSASFMNSIRKFSAFLVNYAKDNKIEIDGNVFQKWERKVSTAVSMDSTLCPLCKKGHIIERDSFFGCSEWKKDGGCGFLLWKSLFAKKHGFNITSNMVEELLSKGKASSEDNSADVYLDNDFGYLNIYVKKKGENVVSDIMCLEKCTELCPSCKKATIEESLWSFSCSKCHLTFWKTPFSRDGYNGVLSRSMFSDLLNEGKVDARILGTSENKGVFILDDYTLSWYPVGVDPKQDEPKATVEIKASQFGKSKGPKKKIRKPKKK